MAALEGALVFGQLWLPLLSFPCLRLCLYCLSWPASVLENRPYRKIGLKANGRILGRLVDELAILRSAVKARTGRGRWRETGENVEKGEKGEKKTDGKARYEMEHEKPCKVQSPEHTQNT